MSPPVEAGLRDSLRAYYENLAGDPVEAHIVDDDGPTVSIQPRWPDHKPPPNGRQAVVDLRIAYGFGDPTGEVLVTVSGHSLAVGRIIATLMQDMANTETESWQ